MNNDSDANAAASPSAASNAAPHTSVKHFTAVFEHNIRKYPANPFLTETPWGRPLAVSVGDALSECDIFREALEGIADGSVSWVDVERVAQDALDEAQAALMRELAKPAEAA